MNFHTDIAVLGGGASGMMAALAAKRAAPGLSVTLLERQSRVGRKLLATGNGRCNLMNTDPADGKYHGDVELLRAVREALPPESLLSVLKKLGIEPKTEYGGRVFPMSQQASSVLDDLRLSLAEAGVAETCGAAVTALRAVPGGVEIALGGQVLLSRRAVACFGGAAAPQLGGTSEGLSILKACGHKVIPFRPALTGLLTDSRLVRPLKGVRLEAEVTLYRGGQALARETGDVIFADYGLSGLAPMALSRAVGDALGGNHQAVEAALNALPGFDPLSLLRERQRRFPARPAGEMTTGLVHKKLGQHLLRLAAPDAPFALPCGELTDGQMRALAALLGGWRLTLTGLAGMEQAQVSSGGVPAREVHIQTLESRKLPGLYLAGEVLNVDGDCGGYNLYWAFASGLTAGHCAARSLM